MDLYDNKGKRFSQLYAPLQTYPEHKANQSVTIAPTFLAVTTSDILTILETFHEASSRHFFLMKSMETAMIFSHIFCLLLLGKICERMFLN